MAAAPRNAAITQNDAAPAAPVAIAPHRAIYTMSLGGVKNGSNITDVSGRMLFEWRDVCDGWAIQQHLQLHFTHNDSEDQDITSTELTWEAKDGKSYNFNVRRQTNGQETENYRGKAVRNEDGSVTATYSVPEGRHEQLPPGTIFPSTHTQMILQNAMKGEKFFSRHVFDGSDEDGSSDISAFISLPRAGAQPASTLDKNPLLSATAWPVHLAFFGTGSAADATGTPDYEMDLDLLPNGVSRRMKIDYSDFSVVGKLEDVQPLPPQACP